jgi:hypothetical protein
VVSVECLGEECSAGELRGAPGPAPGPGGAPRIGPLKKAALTKGQGQEHRNLPYVGTARPMIPRGTSDGFNA